MEHWKAKGRASVVAELLGDQASELESGRIPVLVCQLCGDFGCGAFAVRILREGDRVRWTDWAYENWYEPPQPLEWGDFLFDRQSYEGALGKALEPTSSSWVFRLLAVLRHLLLVVRNGRENYI